MTIKQNGGIFGRNPTFNNVEVEGALTAQSPTFTGDMSIDGNTLFVDASSNRVGLGTNSPAAALHIEQASPIIQFEDTDSGGVYSQINGSGGYGRILLNADPTNVAASTSIQFNIDGSEAARFNDAGNLAFPSGQGIDFSATAGTGTSELLSDYEEGLWTPTQGSFSTWTSPTFTAVYTKIGRVVNLNLRQTGGTVGWSAGQSMGGLPYTVAGSNGSVGYATDSGASSDNGPILAWADGNIYFQKAGSESNLVFTVTYYV